MTHTEIIYPSKNSILKKLKNLNVPKKIFESILPAWWNDELFKTSAGTVEIAVLLKKRLGLKVEFRGDGSLVISPSEVSVEFKSRSGVQISSYFSAICIANGLANTIAGANFRNGIEPQNVEFIREKLIKYPVDTFESLVDLIIHEFGIPIFPLVNLPNSVNKPAAMVINSSGYYSIFICHRIRSFGSLLFILMHELCHIALGHLKGISILTDVTFSQLENVNEYSDKQELEADRLSLNLLRKNQSIQLFLQEIPEDPSVAKLASLAKKYGRMLETSPSHLILSYGKASNNWSAAWNSLKFIEHGSAQEFLLEKYHSFVMSDFYSNEESDFLLGGVK